MKEMKFEHSSKSDNSKKVCCQQIQRITEHHAWLTTKCNEGKRALLACPRFTEMRNHLIQQSRKLVMERVSMTAIMETMVSTKMMPEVLDPSQ